VRLSEGYEVVAFTGKTIDVPSGTPTVPVFDARAAVHEVFVSLLGRGSIPPHLTFTSQVPDVVAAIPHPSYPTVLRKAPFAEPIVASLAVDASGGGAARLLWDVRLALPDGGGNWVVHVTATGPGQRPRIVQVMKASSHAVHGDVFEFDPRDPVQAGRPFPAPRHRYPAFGGAPIPLPRWMDADATEGNNTRAVGPDGHPVRATAHESGFAFKPEPPGSRDHWTVNAFYWCNVMHDFFLLLGFDEEAGNFQTVHASGSPGSGDALDVIVREQFIPGMAFFQNRPDGTSPRLELGPRQERHTALDADVIVHEFVHGVTNRVIGGKHVHTPLTKPQSLALGEGFSDYYAISIQNWFRRKEGRTPEWVYGAYIANLPAGLRTASYESYPNTYGFLRKPKMNAHTAGEVWCAALLELNAVLAPAGDLDAGDELAWQVVFDAITLLHPMPDGPHYLHARDAVVQAFDDLVVKGRIPADPALRSAVVDVFRRRGMGSDARSEDAEFSSVREGFA
jgi:extracellular elastinolytic metalloproteinase